MMNRWTLPLYLFLSLSPFSYAQGDESVSEMIRKGDSAFTLALQEESGYQKAVVYYSRAIAKQTAPSASLIYNLGNSLYLDDKFTEALIAYNKALSLNPGKREIIENLKLARRRLEIEEPLKSPVEYILWFFPSFWGPYRVWTLILLIPVLMIAVLFLLRIRNRRGPVTLFILGGIFSLLQLVSVITWENHEKTKAYIIHDNGSLRKGDSPLFDSVGDYPPGTEIQILHTDHQWSRVRIPGSPLTGWIERNQLMTFEELIDKFQ